MRVTSITIEGDLGITMTVSRHTQRADLRVISIGNRESYTANVNVSWLTFARSALRLINGNEPTENDVKLLDGALAYVW